MDKFASSFSAASRSGTPNAATNPRFTSQASTAEDLLKEQTVGLVHLSDFRKRRAEALEQKERASQNTNFNQVETPDASGAITPQDGIPAPLFKKKRKTVVKTKLSFGLNEGDEADSSGISDITSPCSNTPDTKSRNDGEGTFGTEGSIPKKRLGPNSEVAFTPKVMTKSALLREAQTQEQLRKDFTAMRDAVKATDIVIPFVFYDGTNVPGGICRVKKGDYIWLFLDKARKVGAESRREWARISVDDLMLVRGEIIIPHHYQFYYFMAKKTIGFNGILFDYSTQPTVATPISTDPATTDPATYDPLGKTDKKKDKSPIIPDTELEGFNDDPVITKVVDRRWYERNKHIFPASVWEEFDVGKDYSQNYRKDSEGNSFFFS